MRRHHLVALASALALTALIAGCDKYKMPPGGQPERLPAGAYPRNVADQLVKGLFFGEPRVTPATADRPMRVVQPIRSTVKYDINVQYWFEWFDPEGRPVKATDSEQWRFQHLAPRIEAILDATAPDTHATNWRLHVRPAR